MHRKCSSFHTLQVEYAERGTEHGILFIFSPFCEYIHLAYVRVHVIHRVNQPEYVIHTLVVAPPEYVNIYSTRRFHTLYDASKVAAGVGRRL